MKQHRSTPWLSNCALYWEQKLVVQADKITVVNVFIAYGMHQRRQTLVTAETSRNLDRYGQISNKVASFEESIF